MSKDRKLNEIFVKAAPGMRIKDPITLHLLSEQGEYKPHSTFWARRLMDGDVVQCEPPAAPALEQPAVEVAPALEQAAPVVEVMPALELEQPIEVKKNKKGKE